MAGAMPHPTQRPGGRSARITAAVHAATMAALLEHGFTGMQMEDIAARAGVNKSTLYRRWGSRERLLADALASNSGSQIPVPDTGSLRGDLCALALRVRDAIVAPSTRALMTALAAGHDDDLDAVGRGFWEQRLAAARPIVDRAVARGELPRDSDADELIVRVLGPIWFAVFGPGRAVDDAFVRRSVDVVVGGITTVGGGGLTASDPEARGTE
jgi:AcrR family transcriptional regulator